MNGGNRGIAAAIVIGGMGVTVLAVTAALRLVAPAPAAPGRDRKHRDGTTWV
jgi:hypothetical protein